MALIGKKTQRNKLQQNADQVQNFGIRKLSIGVTSVLLSTFFYVGATNENVVQASTVNSAEQTAQVEQKKDASETNASSSTEQKVATANAVESQQKTQSKLATESSTTDHKNSNLAMPKTKVDIKTYSAAQLDGRKIQTKSSDTQSQHDKLTTSTQNGGIKSEQKPAELNINLKNNSSKLKNGSQITSISKLFAFPKSKLKDSKVTVNNDQNGVIVSTNQDGKDNQAQIGKGKKAQVSLPDGSILSVDNDQLDSTNQIAKLDFNSNSLQAGDKYIIRVPKKGGIKLDGTDVASLQAAQGTTDFDDKSDNNYYIITDTFSVAATVDQNITLHYGYSDKADNPVTKIINNITLSHNNKKAVLKEKFISDGLDVVGGDLTAPKYSFNKDSVTYKSDVSLLLNGQNISLNKLKSLSVQIKLPDYFTPINVDLGGIKSSFTTTDPNTLKINCSSDDLKKMTPNSDGNLAFTLTGKYKIPDNKFIQHNYHVEKMDNSTINIADRPATITAVTNNGASFSGKFNSMAEHYVVDYAKNFGEGVLHVDTTYVAGYIDNDYSGNNPINENSVIINNNHKNSQTISSLHDFSEGLGYEIENQLANHDLKNISTTLTVPDGINTKVATIWQSSANSVDSILVTFTDGSQKLVADPQSFFKNVPEKYQSSKNIKSIKFHFKEWNSGDNLNVSLGTSDRNNNNLEDNAHFAQKYIDGKPVQVNDLLIGKVKIDDGTTSKTLNAFDVCPIAQRGDKLGVFTWEQVNQTSKKPGVTKAGTITYEAADSGFGNPHLQHPVMYIEMPDNATLSDLNGIQIKTGLETAMGWTAPDCETLKPKKISIMPLNGHQILKLDLSNYNDIRKGFSVIVTYSNMPDLLTSTKKSPFIVVADNLDKISLGYSGHLPSSSGADDSLTTLNQLINQENINYKKTVYEGGNTWSINTANGLSTMTMTNGNTENNPVMEAHQDVHIANPDRFNVYGSIINATTSSVVGATQVINLPSTADGKSQFTPLMTGKATVIDANTGKDLSTVGELLYSTSTYDYSRGKDGEVGMTYVESNQVTDWSKIKSVMLRFNNNDALPKMVSARVVIPVQDKHIYDHVGKSIYASSIVYSPIGQLKMFVIKPGGTNSAKLTVQGKSTVKTLVHYKDAQGNDKYVELADKAKTYNELQDKMNRSDFLQSDNDLTALDKSLLPEHLMIDYANPIIINSDQSYVDGYQNGCAAFGKTAKYDFDQDAVVFKAVIGQPVTQKHRVKRTIHYIYGNDKKVQDDTVQQSKEFEQVGYKNPNTGDIKWIDNTDTDTLPEVTDLPTKAGYTADQSSVPALLVNANDDNSDVTVKYTPDLQSVTYRFLDDDNKGRQVGQDITKRGVTDQTLTYSSGTFTVPTGYELVGELPTKYTLKASGNNSIDIHLKHTTTKVSDPEKWPTDLIGSKVDLTHSATRTIEYCDKDSHNKITSSLPTGVSQDAQQTVTFGRTAVVDNVTHKIVGYVDPSDPTKTIADGDHAWQVTSTTKKWAAKDNPTIDHYNGPFAEDGTTSYPEISEQTPTATTNDLTVKVYYTHKTDTITKKTSEYKNSDGSALTDTDFSKTITRTINIIDDKGQTVKSISQPVTFTRKATVDEVTGKVTKYGDWQAENSNNSWDSYTPTIGNGKDIPAGYHISSIKSGDQDYSTVTKDSQGKLTGVGKVDTVVGANVDPTKIADVNVMINYTPDPQNLTVKFIDDTDNGKVLKTVCKTGVTDASAEYNTKDDINTYTGQHYILVSDSTKGQGLTFDDQTGVDQHYEVHLKHSTHTINDSRTINETIHYKMSDKTKAPNDYQTTVKFSRDGFNDEVTNIDHWNAWQPGNTQKLKAVDSPEVAGYTPDTKQVKAYTVGSDTQDIKTTVTYTPNIQLAHVKYIDDTDHKTLMQDDLSGRTNEISGYRTKDRINEFKAQQYILVSDNYPAKGMTFDNQDHIDQQFEVHLTHHLTPIKDHQEVKETIHYVYADGAAHTGKAANDYQATPLEFNRTGEHDNVTNTDSWNAWMPGSLSFSKVDSPMIQGYTPDQQSIDVTPVDANSQDIGKTVTYAPNVQKLTVKFIDDTNDNKVLKTVVKTGYSDEKADYNTKADLQALLNRHYDLASDQTKGNDLVFDHDDDIDQTYEVHLTHHLTPIEDHQEVNETIHYVYANGQAVADDHKARLAFHRTGEHDDVTGTDSWNTWIPGSLSFDKIDSPTIQGYTPDKASIDVMPVSAEDKDLEFKITYAPNSQSSHYRFVDDDNKDSNGKPIQVGTDIVKTGNTDQTITYQDGDFPIPAGYELVSKLPTKYTFKASGNDPIDIHLKHKIVIVTPDDPQQSTDKLPDNPDKTYPSGLSHDDLNETIKRPITVIKPDDSTIDASQTVTLSRTATIDEVTGKIIKYSDWTTGSFAEYNAPEIPGYTPNRNANAVAEVKHGDHFAPITITYIPINSGTGTDEKPDSNPGDKQPSDHTPEPSKSNTEEVRNVPDKNAIKPREIAKHVSIKSTNKVTHSIQIAKSTTKDFKSNVAIHAENLDHRKHKSNVDIDSDIGEAKIQVKGKVNIKDQATSAATKHTLPQTGQKNNDLSLLGLSAAALGMLTALLGTMIDRKRK